MGARMVDDLGDGHNDLFKGSCCCSPGCGWDEPLTVELTLTHDLERIVQEHGIPADAIVADALRLLEHEYARRYPEPDDQQLPLPYE